MSHLRRLIRIALPLFLHPAIDGASLRDLPFDQVSYLNSAALALSGDGRIVVGHATAAGGTSRQVPMVWRADGEPLDAGTVWPGANRGVASAVSADGTRVVGDALNAYQEAFLWTPGGEPLGLGGLRPPPFMSIARGVSGDGRVVVGEGLSNGLEAFRWTSETGMVGLGDLPGGLVLSRAYGVNGDGSVIVGESSGPAGTRAVRWTPGAGIEELGGIPGGDGTGSALAVTPDGSVIIGTAKASSREEAFRWTAATGVVGLGAVPLPDGSTWAGSQGKAVSADGTIVVGSSGYGGACIWRDGGGPEILSEILLSQGVDASSLGWFGLTQATGIHKGTDHLVVVGFGVRGAPFFEGGHYAPFVAVVDLPSVEPDLAFHFDAATRMLRLTVPDGYSLETASELANGSFLPMPTPSGPIPIPTDRAAFFRLRKLP